MSFLGALGAAAGLSVLNNVLSVGAAERQTGLSVDAQKELFDYQWNKAASPQSQVKNLASAGVNPVSQFGSGSANIVGGSMPSVSPQPIQMSMGVDFIKALTSAAKDLADVKKTGVDTTKTEQEIEGVKLSNEMQQLQNQITKEYGIPKVAKELALAAEQVKLAQQQGDLNEVEKAIKKWSEVKEKAISEAEENKRDILKQELDNTAKRLELENKIKQQTINTGKAQEVSAYASAEESRAGAREKRASAASIEFMNDLRSEPKVRASLCQQLEMAGKLAVSANKMTNEQMKLLGQQIEHLRKANSNYEIQMWSEIINNTIRSVASAVGEFSKVGMVKKFMDSSSGTASDGYVGSLQNESFWTNSDR